MIYLANGLKNSLIVLEYLRANEELLSQVDIHVGTFTNCREQGLTFVFTSCRDDDNNYVASDQFTWCIYEHRNSDRIIINGKEGFVSFNGELPYMADDKYTFLGAFDYGHHFEAANKLAELMLEWRDKQLTKKVAAIA